MAGVELFHGSLEQAERYLTVATQGLVSVPADRRERSQVILAVVRMRFARQRGDLPAVAEQAQRLLAPAGAADSTRLELGEDLRALALINLGIAEVWTARFDEADRHLGQGIALAHRIGRPFLEVTGLAHWAQLLSWRSFPLGAQRSRQAIELAGQHGWADEPVAGVAYVLMGRLSLSLSPPSPRMPWVSPSPRRARGRRHRRRAREPSRAARPARSPACSAAPRAGKNASSAAAPSAPGR